MGFSIQVQVQGKVQGYRKWVVAKGEKRWLEK
jgi:hypothetical protein